MHDLMAGHVRRGTVPGIVTLVSRRGKAHVNAVGTKALGGDPVRRDTIFRITSMTKPITAAAAMILVVPHRRTADPRCMKLCYSVCALSAQRSVFSLVREARLVVGPGDLEHP
jgi:hypothetical protein